MKINPCKQDDFLYFYSLQAGVVICSSIGLFLSITTLCVNLASENSEIDGIIIFGHYSLIVIFGLTSALGFFIALLCAYQESKRLALASGIIQLVMFLYWLAFLGVSFIDEPYYIRRVCLENRCPDHLWIQDSRWRVNSGFCDPVDLQLPLPQNMTTAQTEKPKENMGVKVQNPRTKQNISNKAPEPPLVVDKQEDYDTPGGGNDKVWPTYGGVGRNVFKILSIFFSIVIGVFYLYSITTIFSYRNELKELDALEE